MANAEGLDGVWEPVRDTIREWYRTRVPRSVAFREPGVPPVDEHDDYEVVYEAVFEPPSQHQMRVALWLTSDGAIGIGFETLGRVAARLGRRVRRSGFAAGNEPNSLSTGCLLSILDLVSGGHVSLLVKCPLYIHMTTIHVVIPESAAAGVRQLEGGQYLRWLQAPRGTSRWPRRLLTYDPWS